MRVKLRNSLTGFIFGKYDLKKIGLNKLTPNEELISKMEIVYYNEVLLVISVILVIIFPFLITFSPFFILVLILGILLGYFALELEFVFLTDERIIIERRTVIEKLLKSSNESSIALDQIAVVNFGRAPFNIPGVISSFSVLLSSFIFMYFYYNRFQLILLILLVPMSLYGTWYSLRLNKRSLELSVIGAKGLVGIGREKGVREWFVQDLQNLVFERIHHIQHDSGPTGLKRSIREFPLQFSTKASHFINELHEPLHQQIIKLLDGGARTRKEIIKSCSPIKEELVNEAIRDLRIKKFIYYNRSVKMWQLVV